MKNNPVKLPNKGTPSRTVLDRMKRMGASDARWKEGRVFSLVFYAGEEIARLLKDAYTMYFSENGLNPGAFPSLRQMEAEVIAMTSHLLGSDGTVKGNMTSGGTESILMACKTARDHYRKIRPQIKQPEIITPVSAHPAFDKAGHYFDIKITHIPLRDDFRADVDAMQAAINENTIMLVGSAPQYPQGVVDPICELATLARQNNLLMHVDACVGGFMLPFVRRLGYDIPDFDFGVAGVTSMSVDLHKYAYAAKGASIVLYRNLELRRHQYFVYTQWPGGIYGSPSIAGTRPGGAIAAAWAVMNHLGEEGYLELNREVMLSVKKFQDGINAIPGLCVPGKPDMSVMCIMSDQGSDSKLDIYAVGDEMSVRGWHLDRQQNPQSLHLTINWAHSQSVDLFLDDLSDSCKSARGLGQARLQTAMGKVLGFVLKVLPQKLSGKLLSSLAKIGGSGVPKRSAAMYGMMGSLPNQGDLHDVVMELVEGFTDVNMEMYHKNHTDPKAVDDSH